MFSTPLWSPRGISDRERPVYRQSRLEEGIRFAAEWSRAASKALTTTECWSIVDYKDWQLLDWDWVKELCEVGFQAAAATPVRR